MLSIHNSLTGQKAEFQPREPGKVGLYVCGVTAYDYCHLGHARVMVVFDMVRRYLEASGLDVTYVRNITDIDDKIIRRAAQEQISTQAVVDKYVAFMDEDAAALGLQAPDHEPRATAHIDQIIAMVEKLVGNGSAYPADNGDVYFDVSEFESYGALSGKKLKDLRAGARVEVDEAKSDPLDFVLWKAAKPGEPSWPSPWGEGRPGWHIECSAMSTHCLGDHFDIHGGGLDLKFPHHENEIAQSCAATGAAFVNVWMHNGFVTVDDEKMAKSLGNFLTIRDVLSTYSAEEIRYFILSTHYRSPLAYTADSLSGANTALARLYGAMRGSFIDKPAAQSAMAAAFADRFRQAMDDDFNTPGALAVLFDMAREINRLRAEQPAETANLANEMRRLAGTINLLQEDPEDYFQGAGAEGLTADQVDALIQARNEARAQKDFAEADRLRDELQASGIVLEDSATGTTWRRGSA